MHNKKLLITIFGILLLFNTAQGNLLQKLENTAQEIRYQIGQRAYAVRASDPDAIQKIKETRTFIKEQENVLTTLFTHANRTDRLRSHLSSINRTKAYLDVLAHHARKNISLKSS